MSRKPRSRTKNFAQTVERVDAMEKQLKIDKGINSDFPSEIVSPKE
jgi:hypothetical protein